MSVPEEVLFAYGITKGPEVLAGGLMNATFLAEAPSGRIVLQRLHPIFDERVCQDIARITEHLERKGIKTPRLVPTTGGALFVKALGGVWRALSYVEGRAFHRLKDPALAREAGRLVGRFHRAVSSLEHEYAFSRGNVHNTRAHLEKLARALEEKRDHPLFSEVAPLGERVLESAKTLPDLSGLPLRHSHGDLKVSNLLFDDEGKGLCLVDLDTLSRMIWPFEMGDALRSWCNPGGEDEGEVRFDLALFQAALEGYAPEVEGVLTPEEVGLLVEGVRTISLELSARFFADALYEAYFGWDPQRFSSKGEHNLWRGRGQLALFGSVTAQAEEARRIVERVFF